MEAKERIGTGKNTEKYTDKIEKKFSKGNEERLTEF